MIQNIQSHAKEKMENRMQIPKQQQLKEEGKPLLGVVIRKCRTVGKTLTIAIIGPAGSGKSATGNTILGEDAFESKRSMATTTKSMTPKERVEPRKIIVIDTPPLLDTCLELTCEELAKEFHLCMEAAKEWEGYGLDAIVLTLNANGRFTEEVINGIEFARNLFGEKLVTS
ncbi:uncharacterized protein [Ptychodera flava]|uniref:uncharacterized protein n=1 Tax=Ptychodera flava TaxID=63121 RepID=UPI00396A3ADE